MNNTPLSKSTLFRLFHLMDKQYGDLKWWPARDSWEIIVGAILTQNTAWTNVEKGIVNLRQAGLLISPLAILHTKNQIIEQLIKPCGYYRQKTLKLIRFATFLRDNYGGSLSALRKNTMDNLRMELLGIWGIGKETADSILLYALSFPCFVVDAYTIRVLARHYLCAEDTKYDDVQKMFTLLPKKKICGYLSNFMPFS